MRSWLPAVPAPVSSEDYCSLSVSSRLAVATPVARRPSPSFAVSPGGGEPRAAECASRARERRKARARATGALVGGVTTAPVLAPSSPRAIWGRRPASSTGRGAGRASRVILLSLRIPHWSIDRVEPTPRFAAIGISALSPFSCPSGPRPPALPNCRRLHCRDDGGSWTYEGAFQQTIGTGVPTATLGLSPPATRSFLKRGSPPNCMTHIPCRGVSLDLAREPTRDVPLPSRCSLIPAVVTTAGPKCGSPDVVGGLARRVE